MTPYQERICKLANVEFPKMIDSDIITFDEPEDYSGKQPRTWIYLYKENGRLRDLQLGNYVPMSEKKCRRPSLKVNPKVYADEVESDEIPEQKIIQKTVASVVKKSHAEEPKKEKGKWNLSEEERKRRSEHMKKVAQEYWAKKRAEKVNGESK